MTELITSDFGRYAVCGLMGGALGLVELISRYRDDPLAAVQCVAAIIYTLVNVLASLLALFLLETFAPNAMGTPGETKTVVTQILVAGFGAMAFLRTSIFNVSVASDKVAVGPAALLDVLLNASDRAVDRRRAQARSGSLKSMAWDKVSFNKAQGALPPYCFALMQNVSAKEKEAVNRHIQVLKANTQMTSQQKLMLMILVLMNVVGEEVIKEAKAGLGAEIEGDDEQEKEEAKQDMIKSWEAYKARQEARTAQGAS